MNDSILLLRKFINEVVGEVQNYRVSGLQLVSKDKTKKTKEKDEEEVDEMSVAANIAGFTAPIGYSSEDIKGPGAGRRVKKRSSSRWK